MLLPDKELLSEVLCVKVTSIKNIEIKWDMEVLPFWCIEKDRKNNDNDKMYNISIYELAHKCK